MADSRPPTHDGLIEELRELRVRGLTAIRESTVTELAVAARLADYDPYDAGLASAVERLVRKAVERLGKDELGQAAGYTFGTVPGFRDKPASERRKKACQVYGVSTERFRKAHEPRILSQLADAILQLCSRAVPGAAQAIPAARLLPATWTAQIRPDGQVQPGGQNQPGWRGRTVTLHVGPVELLRDIDVVVASTNVYFELSHTFATSLSAALRKAAAIRGEENDHIVDDVIGRELVEELARDERRGLAAAPGSVRVTHSGALQRQGIHRVFHAAVATPRRGSQRYEVDPGTIPAAIRNVFRRAAVERASGLPQLRSICFPLFGAGCGAIDRQQSLRWMLAGLAQELPADAPWEVHLLSRTGGSLDLSDWSQVGGVVG